MYADYDNCLVNLACSVLKEFGASYSHSTLPQMDKLLQKKFKNIIILLLDGMGADSIRHHLAPHGFFNDHLLFEFSSVFPPTTTAATVSLISGQTPCEHGWLGWKQYFRELDQIVVPFRNIDFYTEEMSADYDVAGRYLPYKTIFEQINEIGVGAAYYVSRFGTTPVETLEDLIKTVISLCANNENKFIYAYWYQPDAMMHLNGCYDETVKNELHQLEYAIEKMASQLPDTLLVITADHGHRNLTYYTLTDYPEILKMLKRPISIESRAVVFYVRDEYKEIFPFEFKKRFGNDFILFSKEDIKREKLFGDGVPHEGFDEFIGDFLAAAVSDKGIVYSDSVIKFRSEHAGMTEQEMKIPFIAIENK